MIEMDQRRLSLAQSILQTKYELKRLEKEHNLAQEEFRMGIRSLTAFDFNNNELIEQQVEYGR